MAAPRSRGRPAGEPARDHQRAIGPIGGTSSLIIFTNGRPYRPAGKGENVKSWSGSCRGQSRPVGADEATLFQLSAPDRNRREADSGRAYTLYSVPRNGTSQLAFSASASGASRPRRRTSARRVEEGGSIESRSAHLAIENHRRRRGC